MDPLTDLQPLPPELSLAERIPPPGAFIEALISILPTLPGQAIGIAGDLPDMLRIPDFEHEMEP